MGRVTNVILPTGESLELSSEISDSQGFEVSVSKPSSKLTITDEANKKVILRNGEIFNFHLENITDVLIIPGDEDTTAQKFMNSTLTAVSPWGSHIQISALAKHPLLEASLPVEAEMLPVWSQQSVTLGEDITNTMLLKFSLVGDVRNPQQTLCKEIYVNNSKVLGIEFDQFTSRETFYDHDKMPILTISYDPSGLPLTYRPYNGADSVNISYDNFNR